MALDQFVSDIKAIIFRDRDPHAIPVMDGPFSPNSELDRALPLGDDIAAPDDVACGPDGDLYVSSGRSVLRCRDGGRGMRETVAEFDGEAGPLAFAGATLLVGVGGSGIHAVDAAGSRCVVTEADGGKLRCPTAICVAPDGRIFVTDGSTRNGLERWCFDLMENNRLGRLVAVAPDFSAARTVASGLAWPNGLAIDAAGSHLWMTESWTHSLARFPLGGAGGLGPRQTILPNLAGYPARIATAADGGFWLACFAVRTHLVELVLRERGYREAMMRTIDPSLWIAPMLRSQGGYLEPLQGGAIKKLGIQKPWAPPRSYGLVVRLDAEGEPVSTLHSRVGGQHHGITAARECGGRLVIVSKGCDRLLVRAEGGQA